MKGESEAIDINSAELDELTSLPGIGLNIAEKIIGGRPYSSVEDLRDISGIGKSLFDRIEPLIITRPIGLEAETVVEQPATNDLSQLSLTPVPDKQTYPQEDMQDAQRGSTQTENFDIAPEGLTAAPQLESPQVQPGGEEDSAVILANNQSTPRLSAETGILPEMTGTAIPAAESPSRAADSPKPTSSNSDNKIYGISLTCGSLAILISTALTLAILFMINNGLRYIQPSDLNKIEVQITDINSQADALSRNIQTLTTRMDNLETIAGRVGTVEKELEEARSEIETMTASLESLNKQIDTLDRQVGELEQAANQFTVFLQGLRDLLGTISLPESSN